MTYHRLKMSAENPTPDLRKYLEAKIIRVSQAARRPRFDPRRLLGRKEILFSWRELADRDLTEVGGRRVEGDWQESLGLVEKLIGTFKTQPDVKGIKSGPYFDVIAKECPGLGVTFIRTAVIDPYEGEPTSYRWEVRASR